MVYGDITGGLATSIGDKNQVNKKFIHFYYSATNEVIYFFYLVAARK